MTLFEFLDSEFSVRLVETLGHFLWQGLAIAILVEIIVRCLPRSSSNGRYGFYLISFFLMAMCPFATFVWLAPPEPLAITTEFETQPLAIQGSAPTGKNIGTVPPPRDWRDYASFAVSGYLVIVFALFTRLMLGLLGGRRLGRQAALVIEPSLLEAFQKQVEVLGLIVAPKIAHCGRVVAPTVIGVIKPMILLPVSFGSGLSPAQVEMVLAHELAHIRRWDHLVNLYQRVVEAFLFFHPAVWFISKRIRWERENCCDDLVVRSTGRATDYARALVDMAALAGGPTGTLTPTQVNALDEPSALKRRVLRLVGVRGSQRFLPARGWVVVILLVGLVASTLIYQHTAEEKSGRILKARRFTVVPSSDLADDTEGALLRRRRQVLFTKQVFQSLLYGTEAIEVAAGEGRVMYPHPEEGIIDVVDTKENLLRIENYLSSFPTSSTGENACEIEEVGAGLEARKYVVVSNEVYLSDSPDARKEKREQVLFDKEVFKSLLHGSQTVEEAAAEGRVMYPDPDMGTIDVVDTPENLKKIYEYLDGKQPGRELEQKEEEGQPARPDLILERTFPVRFDQPSEIIERVTNLLSDREEAHALALDDQKLILVRDVSERLAAIERFLNMISVGEGADERKNELSGGLRVETFRLPRVGEGRLTNVRKYQFLYEGLNISFYGDRDHIPDSGRGIKLQSSDDGEVNLVVCDSPERIGFIERYLTTIPTGRGRNAIVTIR